MKRLSILTLSICAMFFVAGCGGEGGPSEIDGPTLSISEARSLALEQFYSADAGEDEYGEKGEFSVYLRDAGTGQDIVCLAMDEGMEQLSFPGIYYGGLSIPFREVIGDLPNEAVRFQLIFVEHDSDGCPDPIDDGDDILGISKEFGFNDLLGRQIWATNGKAAAMLQIAGLETSSVRAMAPSIRKGLYIDKLYFEDSSSSSEPSRYYIFASKIDNGSAVELGELQSDDIAKIRFGGIIYSALGVEVDLVSPSNPNFDMTKIRLGLYAQRDSGIELVGETDFTAIEDLIGEKVSFTNDRGYIAFRNVSQAAFAAAVLRAADLSTLELSEIEHEENLSASSTIEFAIFDPSGSYAIACSGSDQGLADITSPGSHDVDAYLVLVDGQKEIFGWSQVNASLVQRRDGLKCPQPYSDGAKIFGSKQGVGIDDFKSGVIEFDEDAGLAKFK